MDVIWLYDYALIIGACVFGFVFVGLGRRVWGKGFGCRTVYEVAEVETFWTVVPGVILLFLAIPSIHLLYLMDETLTPKARVKVVGHQWYWSYEIGDFISGELDFDSYVVEEVGELRLIEVDNRLVLPFGVRIRAVVTSGDVIHS